MSDGKRVKSGGTAQPTTFGLQLVFWYLPSTTANMAWSTDPPESWTVALSVLGVRSPRGTRMDVQAVFPETPLPKMNNSSKSLFIRALKAKAVEELGVPVTGVSRDVIDWTGTDTEWGYIQTDRGD
tara:strand:- start:1351 stop:1728 length:378 start_codon:yes stop_codon:yes gene_type:complete